MRARFTEALEGGEPDVTPIWLMRQAGRYLPGYQRLRESHGILEIVRDPKLALAATLEPVRLFDVDAGIVFSDITVPLMGLGVEFTIDPGVGPVVRSPLRTESGVEQLTEFDAERSTGFVGETIRRFHRSSDRPIIGFAGSPFTLACYLIEGMHRKDFPTVRAALADPEGFLPALMEKLGEVTLSYLQMQERAGADALQLFDTWAGVLSPDQFRSLVLPYLKGIVRGLDTPVIYFSTASAHLLPELATLGAAGVGVDWRIPLSRARDVLGPGTILQGNLDPAALLAPKEGMERMALAVLQEHPRRSGHVFNLGHGVLPETDPQRVKELVEFVHRNGESR